MRRPKINGQFVPHTIERLKAPAMRVLGLTPRRILDRLEIEWANHGGKDNGKLPLTYADLIEFGIANRNDISRGIRELCGLGLVEITRRGRAGNGAHRSPSLFRITYLPHHGSAPTDEWRLVQTLAQAEQIIRNVRSKSPVSENDTAPVSENDTGTSTGKRTDTPKIPVPENVLHSRSLSIYPLRQAMRPGTDPSSRRSSKSKPAKSLNQGRPCHGKGE